MEGSQTFDEFAHGVLQLNAIQLEHEREQSKDRMEKLPAISFYFSVKTSASANVNAMHGAVSSVDVRETLVQAWNATQIQHQQGELPSNNCYIESLYLLETHNEFPVDMQVSCRQYERIPGNFFSTKIKGDDGTYNKSRNALWVVGARESHTYQDEQRLVFSSKAFVESNTFEMYHRALNHDIDDNTSRIRGGNQVEYLSPTCRIKAGEVFQADWFLDVMYRNHSAFAAPVTSLSFPVSSLNQEQFDDSDEDPEEESHAISLRMNCDDWSRLKGAVNDSVISPLRKSIMDLSIEPTLDFIIVPEVEPGHGGEMQATCSNSQRSGAGYWQALASLMKDETKTSNFMPRVVLKFKATVRFV